MSFRSRIRSSPIFPGFCWGPESHFVSTTFASASLGRLSQQNCFPFSQVNERKAKLGVREDDAGWLLILKRRVKTH